MKKIAHKWQIGEHKSNNIKKGEKKQWKYAPLFPPPPTQLMSGNSEREFGYHTFIPPTHLVPPQPSDIEKNAHPKTKLYIFLA